MLLAQNLSGKDGKKNKILFLLNTDLVTILHQTSVDANSMKRKTNSFFRYFSVNYIRIGLVWVEKNQNLFF